MQSVQVMGQRGGHSSSEYYNYITSEPLQEKFLIKPQNIHTKFLELTFQAIPSLQFARTQAEERWIRREQSRKSSFRRVPN